VASDPTVSRILAVLAAEAGRVLAGIDAARAAARARVWALAGEHAPDTGTSAATPPGIDLDATPVTAHSDKEQAAPTSERGYGFPPLWSFADHGPAGGGEPLGGCCGPVMPDPPPPPTTSPSPAPRRGNSPATAPAPGPAARC
jgi:hypothetical protein